MSLTLGEKLRQAREAKGISVSEVADQTRIASLYLESIDNDDYRALPGGIFNRGFVKSYAKYVGVDEQEALLDYAKLLNDTEGNDVEEVKTYRPQVLTDDNMSSSMLPTLIIAAVVLGLLAGGTLFIVRYLQQPAEQYSGNIPPRSNVNTNAGAIVETTTSAEPTPPTAAEIASAKFEFKALNQPVSLTATVDGTTSVSEVAAGAVKTFEPKTSIKFSYSRSRIEFAQLAINGKTVTLPTSPLNAKRPAIIEFEISNVNLKQILESGGVSTDVPTNSNSARPPR